MPDAWGIILFLVIGIVAGWAAGKIMHGRGFGMLGDMILGIIGAFIGGLLFDFMGIAAGGLIGSLIMAIIGAIVVLFIASLFHRHPTTTRV